MSSRTMADEALDVHIRVQEEVEEVPTESLPRAVSALVKEMDQETLWLLATEALVRGIRKDRRLQVLEREREAEREGQESRKPKNRHGTWNARGKARQGCTCEECTRAIGELEAFEQERMNKMVGLISEYSRTLKIEWTKELLDSEFMLPDGTPVLWGDATVEEHQARQEVLSKNALANAEAAARHRKAISDLTTLGVRTLREAVR